MTRLFKYIIVLTLLVGAYLFFSQEEWQAMDSADLGISAMAPGIGEKQTESDLDSLLGKYKSEGVDFTVGKEMFSVTRTTSRKIKHGQITISEYEKGFIQWLRKEYGIRHQSTESIKHDGLTGIELKFLLPDNSTAAYFRCFIKPNAVYTAGVIAPQSWKNSYRRYRFFNSVKIDD